MLRTPSQLDRSPRRGSLLPAIAVAILTVGCCLALVLDRLWLDAARRELQTAAEAAALAAAGRLADDERINPDVDPQLLTAAAREVAVGVAGNNRCAGRPVLLDAEPGGHLQFGSYAMNPDNGLHEFSETELLPTSVRCRIAQTRELGNPVARLFSGLSGQAGGDAIGIAEASLSNQIVGVRPFDGGPAPALPLAILERDSTGQRTDTWSAQVEGGQGGDAWSFDYASNKVVPQPDGLPELVLTPMASGGKPEDANLQLLNIGNGLHPDDLVRQIDNGWTVGDLADFGGELRLDQGRLSLQSSASLDEPTLEALLRSIGQKRVVLLYELYQPGDGSLGTLSPTRFAAVRVLSVDVSSGEAKVTVQPTVLATRTALLTTEALLPDDAAALANPYVYKLSLTN